MIIEQNVLSRPTEEGDNLKIVSEKNFESLAVMENKQHQVKARLISIRLNGSHTRVSSKERSKAFI